MIFTSSKLINHTRTAAALTSSQAGLSDEDILNMASDSMILEIVPAVLAQYEGHFLFEQRVPLEDGKTSYRIPNRAVGSLMQAIYLKSANGTKTDILKANVSEAINQPTGTAPRPSSYMIVSNSVVVAPAPKNPTDELCFLYYFQPNSLVPESACRAVVSVSGNMVTLPSIPNAFNLSQKFDVINHQSGNEIVAIDLTYVSHIGTTITFAENVEAMGVSAGNWLAQSGKSPVPMIPEILHPLLAETVVERIAEIRQDEARIKQARERIKRIKDSMQIVFKSRVLSKPPIIVPRVPWI